MKKHTMMSALLSVSMLTGSVSSFPILAAEPAVQNETTDAAQSTTTIYDHARKTWYPMGTGMQVETVTNEGKYFKGHAAIDDVNAENTVKDLLHGEKSFTFEIEYKTPENTSANQMEYQMILSNGDHGFVVRDYHYQNLGITTQLIAYGANTNDWMTYNMKEYEAGNTDYSNRVHTVLAGYDAETKELFFVFNDGSSYRGSMSGTGGIKATNYPLSIGTDPENTDRVSAYRFKSVKLFEGVKTKEDMETLTKADAKVWVDADDNPVQPQEPEPEPVVLDYSVLQAAYTDASSVSADKFQSNAAWSTLIEKRTVAANILADQDNTARTQKDINDAASALSQAWLAVRLSVDTEINPLPAQ